MPQSARNSTADFVPRATRYSLQMSVRYRASGAGNWQNGTTENISRSGILFRGAQLLDPFVSLEMTLALPVEIAGMRGAQVVCRGRVVRVNPPQAPDERPALAATIEEFGFVRANEAAHP